MIRIRKADERGYADHGWLRTYHTFSFGHYHDPQQMGFQTLRVMNEDRVAPEKGFPTHAHRDMEIVSYVLEGALQHRDSMGHGEVLKPGQFQRITAGSGITHSEFNPSDESETHFYQIWIVPEAKGLKPSYEQRSFNPSGRQGQWQLVASRDSRDDSLHIHQDVNIYLANLNRGQALDATLASGRSAWLQVLRGSVAINGVRLAESDGAAIAKVPSLRLDATSDAEVMLFDMA